MKYVWIQEGNRQRWKMSISESSEIKRWKKVDHRGGGGGPPSAAFLSSVAPIVSHMHVYLLTYLLTYVTYLLTYLTYLVSQT